MAPFDPSSNASSRRAAGRLVETRRRWRRINREEDRPLFFTVTFLISIPTAARYQRSICSLCIRHYAAGPRKGKENERKSSGGVLFSRRFSGYRVYHHHLSTPRADQSQPIKEGWNGSSLSSRKWFLQEARCGPSLSLSLRHGETCRIKRATSVEKFTPPLCVYAIFLAPPRLTFPLTKRSSFVPSLVFPSASLPGKENGCCANVRDVLHSIPLSLKAAW